MSTHATAGRTRTLGFAVALLALSQVLSRVLGFARDAVIAAQLGATPATDAYYAAFQLPDLLNYFLAGGALTVVFVPFYLRFMAEGRQEAGWRLFSNVLTVTATLLIVAMIGAWFATPWFAAHVYHSFDAEQQALVVKLMRIVLPGPLFFAVGGLLTAVEVARKRFWAPALAPLVYNACIILGGLLLGPRLGVAGFAWGVLAGAILGPFGVPLLFAAGHVRFRPRIELRSPDLRRYFLLALPLMAGLTLLTVDEWFCRYFGQAETGAITWLNNARRLMLLPFALIGQSIGQAVLPYLSQHAAEGREDELLKTLRDAVQGAAALAAVSVCGVAITSWTAVSTVFERGAYDAAAATATGTLLCLMSFAIPGLSVMAVVQRAFFARQDTLRPMLVNTVVVVLTVPIYATLAAKWGAYGLATATSLGLTMSCAVVLEAYRRIHGGSLWGSLARGFGGGAVAGVPAAAAAWGVSLLAGVSVTRGGAGGFVLLAAVFCAVALPILLRSGGPAAKVVRGRLSGIARRFGMGRVMAGKN